MEGATGLAPAVGSMATSRVSITLRTQRRAKDVHAYMLAHINAHTRARILVGV